MALYAEQGFERTTAAEIADRAGVTARTFFRHFADKREVLFGGSATLEQQMVAALSTAPATAPPMAAIAAALAAAGDFITDRELSRLRQAVITATPELRERELSKLASLAKALSAALEQRGVAPGVAALAAETGVAVFRVAFERWLAASDGTDLATAVRATLVDLTGLAAPAAPTS
jgi:AcrR family transcriptional regulator